MIFIGASLGFIGAPLVSIGAPLDFIGTPMIFIGASFGFIGAPLVSIGTPLDFIGASLDCIGGPMGLIGASLDCIGTPLIFVSPPLARIRARPNTGVCCRLRTAALRWSLGRHGRRDQKLPVRGQGGQIAGGASLVDLEGNIEQQALLGAEFARRGLDMQTPSAIARSSTTVRFLPRPDLVTVYLPQTQRTQPATCNAFVRSGRDSSETTHCRFIRFLIY